MSAAKVGQEAAETVSKSLGQVFKEVLDSNKPIVDAFDNATGVKTFVEDMVSKGGSHDLAKAAQKAGYYTTNEAGKIASYNIPKIAGAYVAASTAGRIVTGGGLYRDRNGNTNLIGLPIV